MTKEKISQICIVKINENIRAVEQGQPLTLPLHELKCDCRFMKFYNDFYNIKNADRIAKEEQQKKEKVKARQKAYQKAYYQRSEVKARQKAYQKAYYQRSEVKARQKAYQKAYKKEYNQRPEAKAYQKAYYKANKDKIAKQMKAYYLKRKKENSK